MVPLVLTFVGGDRPGLVNAISEKIVACGASWLESRSARLAGKFAGILLVSVPEERVTDLQSSLSLLENEGLQVTVERGASTESGKAHGQIFKLDLLGHERPGIVHEVTQALTSLGVNIEEFNSDLESAPFSGIKMFRASARLRARDGLRVEDLQKALELLAGEMMVDLSTGDDETCN